MSGGHFDYNQYRIDSISEELKVIVNNPETSLEYFSNEDKEAILIVIQQAIKVLDVAFIYSNRLDWLLSGDDGVESFKRRLLEDLKALQK